MAFFAKKWGFSLRQGGFWVKYTTNGIMNIEYLILNIEGKNGGKQNITHKYNI